MFFRYRNLNQRGSALIQVIVASAVVGILSLSIASMIHQQQQSVAYLEDSLSYVSLQAELTKVFSSPDHCTQNVEHTAMGAVGTAHKFTLKDQLGKTLYTPTAGGRFDKLNLTASIHNVGVNTVNSSGGAEVVIEVVRQRSGGGPQHLKPIKFNAIVAVDGSKEVTLCSPEGVTSIGDCVAPTDDSFGNQDLRVYKSGEVFRKWVRGTPSSACHNNGERIDTLHEYKCDAGKHVLIPGPAISSVIAVSGGNDCNANG